MATKRKCLNLEEKMDVVKYAEKNKLSIRQLASQFLVSKTQIADILKQRGEIKKIHAENGNIRRKRKFKKTGGVAVDAAVSAWFYEVQKKGISPSGRQIKEKALEVAKELNVELKASNGWLDKFCRRHNIVLKKSRENITSYNNNDDTKNSKNKFSFTTHDYATNNTSLNVHVEDFTTTNNVKNETNEIKEETCENEVQQNEIDNSVEIKTTLSDINEAHLSLKNIENYFIMTGDFVGAQKITEVLKHVESEMMKREFCSFY